MNGRRWAWLALGIAAVAALLALAVHEGLGRLAELPVHIVVDGEALVDGARLHTLDAWQRGALALGIALVALAAIVVVPLAIIVVLGVVAGGVALGIALPLLVVLLVAALVMSPLLLAVLGTAWLVRRARRRGASIAA